MSGTEAVGYVRHRFSLLLAAASVVALGWVSEARAQTVTIELETYPGGAATVQNDIITNQYQSAGMVVSGVGTLQIYDLGGSYGDTGHSVIQSASDVTLTFSPAISSLSFSIGNLDLPYAARAY